MRRLRVNSVLVCGRQLHPPLYSHVVNFPRLELPLRGCYENKIEADGGIVTVQLRPGAALFAAPNCWNLPVWQPGLELMSLLFGAKQIGISIVTSAMPRAGRNWTRKNFHVPAPLVGPLPHIAGGDDGSCRPPTSASDIFPELARALIQLRADLAPTARRRRRQPAAPRACWKTSASFCKTIINTKSRAIPWRNNSTSRPIIFRACFQTHGHMTFSSYLTHVRIDRAKHLLRNYNLKLDEIAARCGYYDASYFCHVFKRLTKMTPAEYRVKVRDL